jgi:hypothetical protein
MRTVELFRLLGKIPTGAVPRRTLLTTGASVLGGVLAGCLISPSSGGPPYQTHEIDDGAVYGPGLQDEQSMQFYAALVEDEAATNAFDPRGLMETNAREFIERTDFRRQYLGVVQIGGINSSMRVRVPDVSESTVNLTVIASLEDEPPYSEDRVITTLLIRVTRAWRTVPDNIRVELPIDGRHQVFTGD